MNISKKINLKEGEKIIMTVAPSPFTYAGHVIVGMLLLVATSFFMFKLLSMGWWGDVAYAAGMLAGVYVMVRGFLVGKKNILVLTGTRLVDIHRVGWFDEVISSVNYLDVKDVAVRTKGVWQNIFNIGSISVMTKSDRFVIEVVRIKNPAKIQTLISDIGQQYRQDISLANNQVIYNNFVKIIPNLPDGDLRQVRKIIDQHIGVDTNSV